jgi:hypothetical protein
MTDWVGGGLERKRLFKNATTGKAKPVRPSTAKKKNAQRVPPFGSLKLTTASSPPQPSNVMINEAGKKARIEK